MKININNRKLNKFLSRFNEKDKSKILYLLYSVTNRMSLSRKEEHDIMMDYMKAIIIMQTRGVSVDDIVHRLDAKNIGEFYKEVPHRWFPLNSAAKIYPLSMNHRWMAMFRLSCYLKTDVQKDILQMALNFTIKRFPYFATSVKRGFFWHYLDGVNKHYQICGENTRPCSAIKIGRSQTPFRVIYYKNRISVEYFHILTDGMGGTIFLKTLVAEYLKLLGEKVEYSDTIFNVNEFPHPQEWADDFSKAIPSDKQISFNQPQALPIRGNMESMKPYQVLHFEMDGKALHSKAKEYGVTVTALMLTYITLATKKAARIKNKNNSNIQIQVPCNMRKYYNSKTVSNFAMYGVLKFAPESITDRKSLSSTMQGVLRHDTSKNELNKQMLAANSLVKKLKFIPLTVKDFVAKPIYGLMGDKSFSNVLSNLGVVKFPENLQKHIEKMDFVLGPTLTNRVATAMVTNGGSAVFTITKMTKDDAFEQEMKRLIELDGLELTIKGSETYDYRRKRKHISRNK